MEGWNCPFSPSFLFFMGLAAIHIIAALINFDIATLPCGIIYFLFIPSCFIFLQIYSVANLNDVSWGTRQGTNNAKKTDDRSFFQKILGTTNDDIDESSINGTTCSCMLCPRILPQSDATQQSQMQQNTKAQSIQTDQSEITIISEVPQDEHIEEFEDCAATNISITENQNIPEVASPQEISMFMPRNDQALEKKINDVEYDFIMSKLIFRESYYGGHTISIMRDCSPVEWTEKITNFSDDVQFRLKSNPVQSTDTVNLFTKQTLFQREILQFDNEQLYLPGEDREKIHRTEINYLGWVLSARSPIHASCTVHVLSNPEFAFWQAMCSTDDGYIGLQGVTISIYIHIMRYTTLFSIMFVRHRKSLLIQKTMFF